MRHVVPVLSLTAAALVLAGCTAAPDADTADGAATECIGISSGAASDSIGITGDAGADPNVVIEPPVTTELTQRTIVAEGDGELVEPGSSVTVEFTVFLGSTGEQVTTTEHGGTGAVQLVVDLTQQLAAFVKTVECAHVGDRIVSVADSADAFGETGYPDLGIGADEDIVIVLDIVSLQPTRADGDEKELPSDFPLSVEFDDDGRPTVTIPDAEPPAELTIALTRTGDGIVVAAGDNVTVQYQGVNWTNGEVFDESWGRGPTSFTTTGVIKGFGDALVGQTVGSQVVVIIPPELGYGPQGGSAGAGIAEDDTLVFVVDILGTAPVG